MSITRIETAEGVATIKRRPVRDFIAALVPSLKNTGSIATIEIVDSGNTDITMREVEAQLAWRRKRTRGKF